MAMEKCGQCGGSLEACSCRRQPCLESAEGELLVFLDGHDDAILGLAEVDGEPRVVYDRGAIIRKLMRRDGMDEEGSRNFSTTTSRAAMLAPARRALWRSC
jgi:hypothetical protein